MNPQDYLKNVQAVTLPNQGGNYQAPVFTTTPSAASPIQPMVPAKPLFAPVPKVQGASPTQQPPSPYINPQTGQQYTPEEYANNLATKITLGKGTGDIPQYAGDYLTAATLNNARNDIATGTTDPYKVGNQSGINYSPSELKAIESAYAGIYDPAINSALARLDENKKRADQIFATNESIRQWKATTGTGPTYSSAGGAGQFTKTQLNNGASNAGMTIDSFLTLDDDLKNFYINPPTGIDPSTNKSVPIYNIFQKALDEVKNGTSTADEVTKEIMDSNLPDTVKHYFIDQMPLSQPVKQGYFQKLWGAITGQ